MSDTHTCSEDAIVDMVVEMSNGSNECTDSLHVVRELHRLNPSAGDKEAILNEIMIWKEQYRYTIERLELMETLVSGMSCGTFNSALP